MPRSYRFDRFEVLPTERLLLVEGRPAVLGSRAFDVLVTLIERRDRVVTKNELLDAAWPGLVVEENNLQAQVSGLRKLLGARVFTTIPGIGYRFSAVMQDECDARAADDPTEPAPRTNVPAAVESLIGRAEEIAAVKQALAGHRLVTIVGPGGIGKTRLAQQVALDLVGQFADGVWWVDLATVSSHDMAAPAIANAASLQLGNGEAIAELSRLVQGREMLLVLDNCERLVPAIASVARAVLAAGPAVRLLATSQELLRIPGEAAYVLPGLAVARPGQPLKEAREAPALQLLERRARAADPRFSLATTNLARAVELCGKLDGIALAIEMAAARIPLMGIEALLERLGDRLSLLANADRGASPRYRSLRTTLEWSYSLLSPAQQDMLRTLSAFAGSFSLDSARHVAGAASEAEFLDTLSALVDKSLVRVDRTDPPRYRLLETTRLYGLELLQERAEKADILKRHGLAMAKLAQHAIETFEHEPESRCMALFGPDYDDFLVAFERAHEAGDTDVAAVTGIVLMRIEGVRGLHFLMLRRKQAAMSMLPLAGEFARARFWACIANGRVRCPGVSPLVAAREEVEAWRRLGLPRPTFRALSNLAAKVGMSGRFAEAEAILAEARALRDPAWPAQVRAAYDMWAPAVAAYIGDLDVLKARIEDEERVAEEAGYVRLAINAAVQRAEWALLAGDIKLALELGREAIARARAIDHQFNAANAIATYCDSLLTAGTLEPVPALLGEIIPSALRSGIGGWAFDPLALYAARVGDFELAARLLGFSDARYSEIEEVRRPWDARIAAECAAECGSALGNAGFERLRAAGASLDADAGLALADRLTSSAPVAA